MVGEGRPSTPSAPRETSEAPKLPFSLLPYIFRYSQALGVFFEKKKQKTFIHWSPAKPRWSPAKPRIKVFWFFFSKKNSSTFLPFALRTPPINAIDCRDLVKTFEKTGPNPVRALDGVSIAIRPNEFLTLLGPSGCGKTTLLRLIGGFETQDSGTIHLNGAPLDGLPPYRRPVNTVFQSYAVFPHMTVAQNVAFGLQMQRRPKPEIRDRVTEMLNLVKLQGLGGRRPAQLSGGQQQRVALARALAGAPKVLLLDEPLSALDLKLRTDMQLELKRLQSELGITFIFVTHDQHEALTMSDRIAVMSAGPHPPARHPPGHLRAPRHPFRRRIHR